MCDASASASALAGPVQPALRASRVEVDVSKFPLRSSAQRAGGVLGWWRDGLQAEKSSEFLVGDRTRGRAGLRLLQRRLRASTMKDLKKEAGTGSRLFSGRLEERGNPRARLGVLQGWEGDAVTDGSEC